VRCSTASSGLPRALAALPRPPCAAASAGLSGWVELEDARVLLVRLFVFAERQEELGKVEMGGNVLGPKLEGTLVRLVLELELADHLVDETEVVGPAEVTGFEPLGVDECDLRRVVQVMGDVVGAERSIGIGEVDVGALGLELGDAFLECLKAPPGRILHGRQVGQRQRGEFRAIEGAGPE